jgi:hypothetical protein
MFGLKSYQQKHYASAGQTVALPPAEQPKRLPALVRPSPLKNRPAAVIGFDEYLALANDLKIGPAQTGQVLQRAVADTLWEHNIEMYSYGDVVAYMTKVANKANALFCWRPLRERDHAPGKAQRNGDWGWGDEARHDHYRPHLWGCRTYDKPIPFDVLQNVKLLEDKFPERLHFFVSDYRAVDPDPFMMVTARDMSRIVFGVWDEPAFFRDR